MIMKKLLLAPALAGVLLVQINTSSNSLYGADIEVTTTTSPGCVSVCNTITLHTKIIHLDGDTEDFFQNVPSGCTILIDQNQTCITSGDISAQVSSDLRTARYTVHGQSTT